MSDQGYQTVPIPPAAAYRHCRRLASDHYENFPVASRLLPRRLRDPVAAIYAFARTADDIADEGDAPAQARLERLDAYGEALATALVGRPPADPVFVALADACRRHRLPGQSLRDLLTAFRADCTHTRYPDFDALRAYCRCSADPVGRLLLHLFGAATPGNLERSDRVCTGLQLANFLQDIASDYRERGRLYLPLDEMARFGVDEAQLRAGRADTALRGLVHYQARRAREYLLAGAPLASDLPGRPGWELRLIVAGGLVTLERVVANPAPLEPARLRRRDWPRVLWRALRMGREAT